MTAKPKILAFAGSAREGSFNKKLAKVAAEALEEAGADVTFADLKDYPMPLYNADLESQEGLPGPARTFKKLMLESDGFLISSPEYNSSITPLLKNVIDWASRKESEDEAPLKAYKGKTAAIISASPGALGGLRGLVTLRSILGNIGVIVLPKQYALSKAGEAFDDDGNLKDPEAGKTIETICRELVTVTGRLKDK